MLRASAELPIFTAEEAGATQRRLARYLAGSERLIVYRWLDHDIQQETIEKLAAVSLIINALIMQRGSDRVLRLFEFNPNTAFPSHLERYSLANYFRSLMTGGFAALENYNIWLKVVFGEVPQLAPRPEGLTELAHLLRNCAGNADESTFARAEFGFSFGDVDAAFQQFTLSTNTPLTWTLTSGPHRVALVFDTLAKHPGVTLRHTTNARALLAEVEGRAANAQSYLDAFSYLESLERPLWS